MNLRTTLQTELDVLKAQVTGKEAALVRIEGTVSALLDKELDEVKEIFASIAHHFS